MTRAAWMRRFHARGVFWRHFLRWATLAVPIWSEPMIIGTWSFLFLLWRDGRRGVMNNLRSIHPGSWAIVNFLRTYRVFWNFAWTITDTMRFKELHVVPDWEFDGREHLDAMVREPGGAIILTAHMGSYDLGAHLFGETTDRQILMVRAPEVDPDTHDFEQKHHDRTGSEAVRVGFNTNSDDLALELLSAIREGHLVAIQGDRVTPDISSITTRLFGREADLPSGPFMLGMAARVPIYPLFIVRRGRRRYRLIVRPPIRLERRSRARDEDLQRAVDSWAHTLEGVIAASWQQWFAFYPFARENQP